MAQGTPQVTCNMVLKKRGRQPDGSWLDDDQLCAETAVTDVIVTFNGNAYIVPLCGEHKRHHDQAAAERRAQRAGANRAAADRATTKRRVNHVNNVTRN
jgi:hypothetical protein